MASRSGGRGRAGKMKAVRVLAADIGGTHTRVLLAEVSTRQVEPLCERHYASSAYPELLPILQAFLGEVEATPAYACLAIAGPITGAAGQQQARVTNLPWQLDAQALAQALAIKRLALINDFAAVAHALPALRAEDRVALQNAPPDAAAPSAVLGAGTGLGQAVLLPHATGYTVLATEGGHVDFAPQTQEQWRILRSLQTLYGHVSYERLLSGAGLAYLYRFLWERRHAAQPAGLLEAPDPAAAVSMAALAGSDEIAVQALHEFVSIYGAQAGNLALNCLPYGGLYLAGGIAPKILTKLQDGTFLQAFNAKGRMAPVTQRVPVWVIVHATPGLLGAAYYAAQLVD